MCTNTPVHTSRFIIKASPQLPYQTSLRRLITRFSQADNSNFQNSISSIIIPAPNKIESKTVHGKEEEKMKTVSMTTQFSRSVTDAPELEMNLFHNRLNAHSNRSTSDWKLIALHPLRRAVTVKKKIRGKQRGRSGRICLIHVSRMLEYFDNAKKKPGTNENKILPGCTFFCAPPRLWKRNCILG